MLSILIDSLWGGEQLELFRVELAGYKKFKTKTHIKTGGKLVAILGANEAGKSSLLSAMVRLNDREPFERSDTSFDADKNSTSIKARFLLDDEDRGACGFPECIWFEITKKSNGKAVWNAEPRAAGRDISHRARLQSTFSEILSKTKFVEELKAADETIFDDLLNALTALEGANEDLESEAIETLKAVSERVSEISGMKIPKYFSAFVALLQQAVTLESAENTYLKGGQELVRRMPKFILFGDEDRNLLSSYSVDGLSGDAEPPAALANLMEVAECDLKRFIQCYEEGDRPKFDTMQERANACLERKFRAVWKQSAISVVISVNDGRLDVQIRNPDLRRTDLSERSDGLRQFVALQSFTTCRGEKNPILLIDEAEQHLHYDAQADLIQMLAEQVIAPKVIYTTHSAGCLPEDLGNGVRLVGEISKGSEWSHVQNKFWDSKQTTFSPLLVGMGASAMAFFPTRAAVLVEGESDMLLYPSMFRAALGVKSLGFQFVPGLSRIDDQKLPLLNSAGNRVCYLLDGDQGGKDKIKFLRSKGISMEQIFSLARASGKACELEDFVEPRLLAEAVNRLGQMHLAQPNLIEKVILPQFGKWGRIVDELKAKNVPLFQKTDIAYAVLDLLDDNPQRAILDSRNLPVFVKSAHKVKAYFETFATSRDAI